MINVFVYGTLRKGEANAKLLKSATCIAEQCWTNGLLYDTGYGYPAMKQAPFSRVFGELYALSEADLTRLDQLEGYTEGGTNNLYERIEQTVYTDKGTTIAYMYVASKADLLQRKILNGDWKEHNLLLKQSGTVLYFAYGSCMDQKRIGDAGVAHHFRNMLGVGLLTNYTLRFTRKSTKDRMGRADIVEEGGYVEGKVYNLPIRVLEEYLYGREGAPKAYRPTFVEIEINVKKVQALTFVVTKKEEETAPPQWYKEEILRGAEGYLTVDYISKIQNHINSLKKSKLKIGGM
ncbi:gamma-glutamylcyclotransferase [Alkalihalobacterium alkalinitrilicum]|uniref:gamma-glutamylcyclotransferase n=1 Tax=Alkalihalobacterium alkalinitrilicum TaxID=427920 RepID=UPI001C55B836|nr:gamma-glutamylcyclotransferase family protein [Alkalihalobacterium alkalinitrilicum]